MRKMLEKSPLPAPPPPQEGDKPVHIIRYGDARGCIWKSEESGKTPFTVTADHCPRDKAGNEEVSQTFGSSDLRNLAKTIVECQKWIEWQERRLAEGGRDVHSAIT